MCVYIAEWNRMVFELMCSCEWGIFGHEV